MLQLKLHEIFRVGTLRKDGSRACQKLTDKEMRKSGRGPDSTSC